MATTKSTQPHASTAPGSEIFDLTQQPFLPFHFFFESVMFDFESSNACIELHVKSGLGLQR